MYFHLYGNAKRLECFPTLHIVLKRECKLCVISKFFHLFLKVLTVARNALKSRMLPTPVRKFMTEHCYTLQPLIESSTNGKPNNQTLLLSLVFDRFSVVHFSIQYDRTYKRRKETLVFHIICGALGTEDGNKWKANRNHETNLTLPNYRLNYQPKYSLRFFKWLCSESKIVLAPTNNEGNIGVICIVGYAQLETVDISRTIPVCNAEIK